MTKIWVISANFGVKFAEICYLFNEHLLKK